MSLAETVRETLHELHSVKEWAGSVYDGTVPPIVDCYRDGERVARSWLPRMPATQQLDDVATLMTWGLDADWVVTGFDAWATRDQINPLTGDHWDAGEIEQLLGAGVLTLLTQKLLVFGMGRGGTTAAGMQGYSLHGERVVWEAPSVMSPLTGVSPLLGLLSFPPGNMSPDMEPVLQHLRNGSDDRVVLDMLVLEKVQADYPNVRMFLTSGNADPVSGARGLPIQAQSR